MWLVLLVLLPLQIYFGDLTGLQVHATQPLKTAAMEGVWDTQAGAPLILFAIPDQKNQMNHWELSIPHGAALFNTHQWNGLLTGLKTVPIQEQPKVLPVFFSFRVMVGIGLLMLLLSVVSVYLRLKKRLYETRWFLISSVLSAPLGFIALWCGWVTAEMGRQPWVVYGVLKTADAVSRVPLRDVMISFGLMFIVYGIIFGYFYFYFLHKTLHKGPSDIQEKEGPHQPFQYMPSSFTENR
jgi:cytochrome d ubiquinol oxidase subunit I